MPLIQIYEEFTTCSNPILHFIMHCFPFYAFVETGHPFMSFCPKMKETQGIVCTQFHDVIHSPTSVPSLGTLVITFVSLPLEATSGIKYYYDLGVMGMKDRVYA